MGTKNNPGTYDCYANALPDEPMFVLLARDPRAPCIVRQWADYRDHDIYCGMRPGTDGAMVEEARACADAMKKWRTVNDGAWRLPKPQEDGKAIRDAAAILTDASYGGSKAAGWHNDMRTGLPRTDEENHALFPMRIALCHSELSEALEGHRKSLKDDKLPHRDMAEVELADTVIRVFDLAGVMGYDLGAAIEEKLAYNARRSDHKIESRRGAGGKLY